MYGASKFGLRGDEGKVGRMNGSGGGKTGRRGLVVTGSHVNGGGLGYDRNIEVGSMAQFLTLTEGLAAKPGWVDRLGSRGSEKVPVDF